MGAEHVIEAEGLTRYFGKKCVVEDVSFGVRRGSVTAFLGRNGSGKTTTIRMLLGLLRPTVGRSRVLGEDSQELSPGVRGRVGYLAENHPVIGWMTVEGHARFQGAFYPRWNSRIFEATVEHFGLEKKAKAGALSRGQRAGLALAMTLAPEPEVLVLDDPALGLDPVARRALLESILYITRDPRRTVLLSSHLLDDIERVADELLILDRAVLRAACSVEAFRERIGQWQMRFEGASPTPPPVPEVKGLLDVLRVKNTLRVTVANPDAGVEEKLRGMGAAEVERVAVNFEEAVTAYMAEKRSRSYLMEALGETRNAKLETRNG